MIKVIAPAQRNPDAKRSLSEFHNYWAESHGPLFANTKNLRGYVQHLTLPETYEGFDPPPTYDGASMFWYDDVDSLRNPPSAPEDVALREAVREDDHQLFDRLPGWPLHHKRASVIAEERVVVDGPTTPEMIKAIWLASRLPGLTHEELFKHWYEVHGALCAKCPGIRRYVQNHALVDAYDVRGMTHDGWSEAWFDDLDSMRRSFASPQWQALREDGRTLFTYPMGIVYARERVQKWEDRPLKDWGAASLTEDEIGARLQNEGYTGLAADPEAPRKIKAAAASNALAVWTTEHLVTIDASRIDARPERR
jgi:uncharacterized protein (TIGR02118 family)